MQLHSGSSSRLMSVMLIAGFWAMLNGQRLDCDVMMNDRETGFNLWSENDLDEQVEGNLTYRRNGMMDEDSDEIEW